MAAASAPTARTDDTAAAPARPRPGVAAGAGCLALNAGLFVHLGWLERAHPDRK